MKFKSYLLAAALLLGGAGAAAVGTSVTLAADEPTKVEAADSVVYRVVGDLENYPAENWNGNGNLVLTLEDDGNYHITLNLAENDAFKFQHDGVYYDHTTFFNIDGVQYISGGNTSDFVVKVAGKYDLSLNAGISTWDNWSHNADGSLIYSPFGFEYLGVTEEVDVTYLDPDGKTVKTVSVPNDSVYTTTWFLVDGYTNVQWYTDEERTQLYVPQILTEDTILYGKGDVAPEDRVIYYEGDKTYFHAWHDQFSEGTSWPGLPIAENSEIVTRKWDTEATVYKITIPGEYLADKIIFNNPDAGVQTKDLDIVDVEGLAVYDDNGYNNVKSAALEFITMFDTLRQEGNICYLLSEENKADLETIVEGYNSLPEGTHALVDCVEDLGAARDDDKDGVMTPAYCTIGETMNYLLINSGVDVTTPAGFIESFEKNASDWIAIVSIAAVSIAAAGLFFFIRKKKSAK